MEKLIAVSLLFLVVVAWIGLLVKAMMCIRNM